MLNNALIAPLDLKLHMLEPGQALGITLKWAETGKLSIINIYMPNNKGHQVEIWPQLERERHCCRMPKPDIALGDFNITKDAIDRSPLQDRPQDRRASDTLRELRLAWNIQDQWRHDSPRERLFMHHHKRNSQYKQERLDRIYSVKKHDKHLFKWEVEPSTTPSDHSIVSVKSAPKDNPTIGSR